MVPITSIYMLPVTSLWIFPFLFSNDFASISMIPIFQWRQYVWFQFSNDVNMYDSNFPMTSICIPPVVVSFVIFQHSCKIDCAWTYHIEVFSPMNTSVFIRVVIQLTRNWLQIHILDTAFVHKIIRNWLQVGVLNTAFVHKSHIKSAVRLAY